MLTGGWVGAAAVDAERDRRDRDAPRGSVGAVLRRKGSDVTAMTPPRIGGWK